MFETEDFKNLIAETVSRVAYLYDMKEYDGQVVEYLNALPEKTRKNLWSASFAKQHRRGGEWSRQPTACEN